jgi:hypothetical protein
LTSGQPWRRDDEASEADHGLARRAVVPRLPIVMEQPTDARPHVVILGGGFGGLTAARQLDGAPVRITLLDRTNRHTF